MSKPIRPEITDEPIAVVGIGCQFPFATGKQEFWRHLCDGQLRTSAFPLSRFVRSDDETERRLASWKGVFFETFQADYKKFRIPPVYQKSISHTMMLLLQAADQCLDDAGIFAKDDQKHDAVDVYCGTCFGFDNTLNNALKVEGVQWIEDLLRQGDERTLANQERLRETLRARFGICSHDRVGEMASSIAARIACHFGFRGRVQTLEAADATGYALLDAAMLSLSAGQAERVLVVSGQRFDNRLIPLALEKKGFSGDSTGTALGEGATALLLMRLSDAQRDGYRIYSVIRGSSAVKHSTSSGFKYSGNVNTKAAVMREAFLRAGMEPASQQLLECVLPAGPLEKQALWDALAEVCGNRPEAVIHEGSSIACCGHGFANAALTAVAAASLALHEGVIPPAAQPLQKAFPARKDMSGMQNCGPRPSEEQACIVAGVCGTSLTGMDWHVVLSAADAISTDNSTTNVGFDVGTDTTATPIAIVGMGGLFGPCASSEQFWESLAAGFDAIQPIPHAILPRDFCFNPEAGKVFTSYTEVGADLKRRDFDLTPFKIFPRRATAIDIAQKVALAAAVEAWHDYAAGAQADVSGRVKVVVASNLSLARERRLASGLHDAELRNLLAEYALPHTLEATAEKYRVDPNGIDHFTFDGILPSGIATLISDCLGLQGVSVAVEAACASSLAALDNAVLSLRRQRCDLALAGGVELPVNLRDLILCSAQMMFSRDKIAPFAVNADGFSAGDGAGMFVLKRLADAERDGNKIYGVIAGVGSSCDANSMTAPDPEGQSLAMRRAFQQTTFSPADVQFVETHGTGTSLGDVAEVAALRSVYAASERSISLKIGSVKSNIGHTFAAAGSAGLLKTLLAIKHQSIPPTLMRRQINPQLPLSDIPAELVTENTPWESRNGLRMAAVSAFGTGGINFHLLLSAKDADAETDGTRQSRN